MIALFPYYWVQVFLLDKQINTPVSYPLTDMWACVSPYIEITQSYDVLSIPTLDQRHATGSRYILQM